MKNYPRSRGEFFHAGGGGLEPDAPSYVERPADEALFRLALNGEYCNVLTARQTGKSSLIVRTAARLEAESIHTAVIDLSFNLGMGITPDQWYLGLLRLVRQAFGLAADESRWWAGKDKISSIQRFREFFSEIVLKQISGQIAIFIDEIDSTLNLPFSDDFFAAIRAMHNERASKPEYKRLTFVLVGTARPADLIKDRTRTPYNIGQTVDLDDFTWENARALLPGLEMVYSQKQSVAILERVLNWTGGQPYLTQRVCAEVVTLGDGGWSNKRIDELVKGLFFQEGQIRREVHLQWIDDYIQKNEYRQEMLQVYGQVLSGEKVKDEERSIEKSYLKLSGVVKATPKGYLQVRNRIYERVFGPGWAGIPESERPKPLPAGIPWQRAGALALVAVILIAGALWVGGFLGGKGETPTPLVSPSLTWTAVVVVSPSPTPSLEARADTPTLTPTRTATREPSETPTQGPPPETETPTSSAEPPSTPTPIPSPSPTTTDTATPISTPSPTATATDTPTPTHKASPIPTSTATSQPLLLEPPTLVEPESGARFPSEVRLKWNWWRRLEGQEKFAVRWEPIDGSPAGDWWVGEDGILGGGGVIYSVGGGYRFEVNCGLGPYPDGEAFWSVAVFDEASGKQISQWSERRQIFKAQP